MTPSEITELQLCICGDADCAVPYSACHCGCGGSVRIAKWTSRDRGHIKGMPIKYIKGHNAYKENSMTKEEKIAYQRKYREVHEERIKILKKQYRQRTREHRAEYNRKYVENNREDVLERGRRMTAYYSEYFPEKFLLWSARRRAKDKHLPFDIEESDIRIPSVCPILGIPLKRGVAYGTKNSPSIDRIIPSLGYVKDNIQIISNMANIMKQDATFEQMVKLGEWANMMMHKTCAVIG